MKQKILFILSLLFISTRVWGAGSATLSMNQVSMNLGAEAELSISLNNSSDQITGLSCDLYLPTGIEIKTVSGQYQISQVSSRVNAQKPHTLEWAKRSDGAIRILNYSSSNQLFIGTSGAIIKVVLTGNSSCQAGTYSLQLKNIVLSRADGSTIEPANYSASIVVQDKQNYDLIYKVDGVVYKTYSVLEGTSITPEQAPTKEGYTFSGWTGLPATMPSHDVTVTGSFTVNSYSLTYMLDGVVYKTISLPFGTTISPEAAPVKTGYTFSGWTGLPATMPSHDVTVTGSYDKNMAGTGSEQDPYQVCSASDLRKIKNEGFYKLMNDIDLTSWIAENSPVDGWHRSDIVSNVTIDGDNKTITGLWGEASASYVGLFGRVEKSTIKNLNVIVQEGKSLKNLNSKGECGILMGESYSVNITGCKTEGTVIGYSAGLIAGVFWGSNSSYTIDACETKGKVLGLDNNAGYLGGVCGKMTKGKISRCITDVQIDICGANCYAGGICGKCDVYSMSLCAAHGSISVRPGFGEKTYAGGLIGEEGTSSSRTRSDSYSTIDISAGITYGLLPEATKVQNCYINANLAALTELYQITANDQNTQGCINIQDYLSKGGDAAAVKTAAYYRNMGWDMDKVWGIDEGISYPYLRIEKASYSLTYIVDGEVYKSYTLSEGTAIPVEAAPIKEGYTFSGWSEIPATMPSHDVTITGSFAANSYTLAYMVDDAEFKSVVLPYGSTITLESTPAKEGYTFSGWSGYPGDLIMPAHDVTITGSFSVNSYTLTYMVDGTEYKSVVLPYGSSIPLETAPAKEGYTFSGWSGYPEDLIMPAHDVTITGSFAEDAPTPLETGKCGANATYTITQDYVLIISGTGSTYDYDNEEEDEETPWYTNISYNDNIHKAIIEEGITRMGTSLFEESNIVKIELPSSLKEIAHYAFFFCGNLREIVIPDGVTEIGVSVFRGCSRLTSITIPNSVRSIGIDAFDGCTSLTSITIPNSLTNIARGTFEGCKSLPSITIPNSVVSIEEHAFSGCSSLSSIIVESSLPPTTMDNCFDGVSKDIPVYVPAGSVNAYKNAQGWKLFTNIRAIGGVEPSNYNLVYLVDGVEWNSSELKEGDKINLLETPTKEGYTFSGWSGYPEDLVMPAHDVTITGSFAEDKPAPLETGKCGPNATYTITQDYVFIISGTGSTYDYEDDEDDGATHSYYAPWHNVSYKDRIKTAIVEEGITRLGNSLFEDSYITSIELPSSLKVIANLAFASCTGLTSITIPEGVTNIEGEYVFSRCSGLTCITLESSIPPSISRDFREIPNVDIPVYVPAGSVDAYKKAVGWRVFTNIRAIGGVEPSNYNLVYLVDGVEWNSSELKEGDKINLLETPTKEGYTFSGWSGYPEDLVMPAHDVTITGSFSVNSYTLTYMIDETEYKSVVLPYGSTITLETVPTKEGYTFSGWSGYPEDLIMPAHDVTVTGTFEEISEDPSTIEDTDISKLDNTIYINNVSGSKGGQLQLSVRMKNNTGIAGFEFSLILPDGITVANIKRGSRLTTKINDEYVFSFNSSPRADGSTYVLCYTSKDAEVAGTDGEVAIVTINIPETIEVGDYPIIIREVEMSKAGSSLRTEYVKSTLTIEDYMLGDATGDGRISVADLTAVASHLLGNTPTGFNEKAADATADGRISVADLTYIASMLLQGTNNAPASRGVNFERVDTFASMYAADVTAEAGMEFDVPVFVSGNSAFSAYQFDAIIPDGLSVARVKLSNDITTKQNTDFCEWNMIDGNTLRTVCFSTAGKLFNDTEGCIAYITLRANDKQTAGIYDLSLVNAEISASGESVMMEEATSTIVLGISTGIESVSEDGANNVYDMRGMQLMRNAKKGEMNKSLNNGLYIVNGKKVQITK